MITFLQIFIIFYLTTSSFEYNYIGNNLGVKNDIINRPRRKLIEKYAQKIVDNFELENYFLPQEGINKSSIGYKNEKEMNHYDGCSTLDEIKSYYFDVYSSISNKNMSENDLENLIEYLVTRNQKNKDIQKKIKDHKCNRKKCFQSKEITDYIESSFIDFNLFSEICPIILFNFELSFCEYDDGKRHLTGYQIWIFGILLTSVVTLWSWNGAVVLPIIEKKIFKRMLTFMISLAFGCLTANSLLKYIPLADGFESIYLEAPAHSYFFKHILILGVIFFFFMFERSMKIFTMYRVQKIKQSEKQNNSSISTINEILSSSNSVFVPELNSDTNNSECELNTKSEKKPRNNNVLQKSISFNVFDENDIIDSKYFGNNLDRSINKDNVNADDEKLKKSLKKYVRVFRRKKSTDKIKRIDTINVTDINFIGMQNLNEVTDKLADRLQKMENISETQENKNNNIRKLKPNRICCTSLTKDLNKVKPIGWMAIFGDGLGNFIDGLSIGASINQGLVHGITTALATWCGNIPQELGDFALLVRAGMSPFQALFYNYLSGNLAYLGCIFGIVFGTNLKAAKWIFSISGATTMYLGIGVLLPEMNEEFEDGNEPLKEKLKITFIQVLGILLGFLIMIILNMFEDEIAF